MNVNELNVYVEPLTLNKVGAKHRPLTLTTLFHQETNASRVSKLAKRDAKNLRTTFFRDCKLGCCRSGCQVCIACWLVHLFSQFYPKNSYHVDGSTMSYV